jgi:hypothetical protein
VPKSLAEAKEMAEIISKSNLCPTNFRGKPDDVLIAAQIGHEVGLKTMQAIQNIAVINGKPSVYGDVGKALLLSHGFKIKRVPDEELAKTEVAWYEITRPDGQVFKRSFTMAEAVAAKLDKKQGPWTDYRLEQLSWRAFWRAAREAASDYLKGLHGREEVEDYHPMRDVTPSNSAPAIPALPGRLSEKAGNCQGLPRIVEVEADPVPTPGEPGSPSPATEAVETQAVEPEVASPNSENVEKVQEIVMYVEQVTGKADGSVYAIFGPRNQQFLTHEKSVAKVASDAKKANKIVKLTYVTASDKGAANGNYVCEISEYKP